MIASPFRRASAAYENEMAPNVAQYEAEPRDPSEEAPQVVPVSGVDRGEGSRRRDKVKVELNILEPRDADLNGQR